MTAMFTEKINLKELEDTIANSTPLLALVGAGDLAVEKLRAARDELTDRAATFDPKTARDNAQSGLAQRVEALQAELLSAPERLQAIPDLAQELPARAQSLFADVVSTAFSTYGELAGRGKDRLTKVRRDVPTGLEVEVDVEIKPVSRPATSTARTSTTATTGTATRPAGKRASTAKTATPNALADPTTLAAKTAAKKSASKTTSKKASAAKKSTSATTTKKA